MNKNTKLSIILIFFILFFCLIQSSVLFHFKILDGFLNPLFLLFLIINLSKSFKDHQAIILSGTMGFLWDIYSAYPFGFYFITLIFLSFLIKLIINKYVWLDVFQKTA